MKQHNQIFNILEMKRFFIEQNVWDKALTELNKTLQYTFKLKDKDISMYGLIALNDYSISFIEHFFTKLYEKVKTHLNKEQR